MTPLWRKHVKRFLNHQSMLHTDLGRWMIESRCFDFTAIEPLLNETAETMAAALKKFDLTEEMSDPAEGVGYKLDIGERVTFPAMHSWLEWKRPDGRRWGVWFIYDPKNLDQQTHAVGIVSEDENNFVGAVSLIDGIATIFRATNGDTAKPGDVAPGELGLMLMLTGLAGLAFLASPAAQRESIEPHRGLAKRLYAAVPATRKITHTTVTLGKIFSHTGARRNRTQPVAYHFCRAHPRRKRGKIEHVRAHWRGDPAFGVRLPTYTVSPGQPQ